jgi:hypothetical protein
MSDQKLRNDLIKLAKANPALRAELLPIIKEARTPGYEALERGILKAQSEYMKQLRGDLLKEAGRHGLEFQRDDAVPDIDYPRQWFLFEGLKITLLYPGKDQTGLYVELDSQRDLPKIFEMLYPKPNQDPVKIVFTNKSFQKWLRSR